MTGERGERVLSTFTRSSIVQLLGYIYIVCVCVFVRLSFSMDDFMVDIIMPAQRGQPAIVPRALDGEEEAGEQGDAATSQTTHTHIYTILYYIYIIYMCGY